MAESKTNLFGRLREASPERQILLAVAVAIVIGGLLVAAYFAWFRTRYEVLFSNLRNADAATILADLDKKKIPYRLKDDGATILVPSDSVTKTRVDIISGDLPLKGTVGFELFNKSDMGLTEFAQKINYQRALQGELARTIMSMESVEEARVHLTLTEQTIFREDRRPAKASVSVMARSGRTLSAQTIAGIQRLVAAAVPDLDISNVVVLDGDGAVVSQAGPESVSVAATDPKIAVEAHYADLVRDVLARLYPSHLVKVTVWATPGPTAWPDPSSLAFAPPPRDFPLRVSISTETALSTEEDQAIRNAVAAAIQAQPQLGDIVMIAPGLPTSPPPPPPSIATSLEAKAPVPQGTGPTLVVLGVLLPGLCLLAMAAMLLRGRRGGGPRRLSAQDRLRYANQLKTLLNTADSNAAG